MGSPPLSSWATEQVRSHPQRALHLPRLPRLLFSRSLPSLPYRLISNHTDWFHVSSFAASGSCSGRGYPFEDLSDIPFQLSCHAPPGASKASFRRRVTRSAPLERSFTYCIFGI